jgi:preprotein translocase subunit SecE
MADARSERHPSVRATSGQPEERHGHFISESWAELKKVEWPGQAQVIQGTVVVLVACVVVGVFLYLNDLLWKPVVSNFFLGQ